MSSEFDPYYKWLGIPPAEQPPHHYRLLGLPPFTDDPDVIENAADQRMAHLRTFQSGKNAQLSQRILNELSNARVVLLNPETKTDYDKRLQEKINDSPALPQLSESATAQQSPSSLVTPTVKPLSRRNPAKSAMRPASAMPQWLIPALIGIGMVVVMILIITSMIVLQTREQQPVAENPVDSSRTSPVLNDDNAKPDPKTPQHNATTGQKAKESQGSNSKQTQASTPSTENDPDRLLKPDSIYAVRIKPRTYIELANTKGVIVRDRPFTVEFWIRCQTDVIIRIVGDRIIGGKHPVVKQGEEVGWALSVFQKNGVDPLVALQNGGLHYKGGESFQWFHVAMSSDGGSITLFENGMKRSTREDKWETGIDNIFVGDGPHNRRPALADSSTIFEIAALRISSSQRYRETFVPPIAFHADEDTVLTLDFNKSIEGRILDKSGNEHHGKIEAAKWVSLSNDRPVPRSN